MKLFSTALLLLTALPSFAQSPANVSVLPANGIQDYTRTAPFLVQWSTTLGAGAIQDARLYIGGCYARVSGGRFYLLDPDTQQFVDGGFVGGLGSVQNRLCGLYVDSLGVNGNLFSAQFLMTFTFPMASRNPGGTSYPIYIFAMDAFGHASNFEQKGIYSITLPGSAVRVMPTSEE